MRRLIVIFLLIFFCSFSQAQEYLDVTKDSRPQFPQDFFFKKDYRYSGGISPGIFLIQMVGNSDMS